MPTSLSLPGVAAIAGANRLPAWRLLIVTLLVATGIGVGDDAAAGDRKRGSEGDPAALYHNYCSVCHGDRGDGNSRAKGSLVPPPRDFTRATELTRDTMITIIKYGKPGTAMAGWGTQLNDKEVAAVTDYVRNTFMKVATDPVLQRGKTLYAQNCMVCHGDRGQGAAAASGLIPARDFTTPQARTELTRERMIASVTNGRANTQMAPFKGRLSDPDIAAVVDYVIAGLMLPASGSISGTSAHANRSGDDTMSLPFINGLTGNAAKGERFYKDNCATCHGVTGDGKGPRAYFINPKPRNFRDDGFRNAFNRPAIYRAVAEGRLGAEMPAWNKVLTDQQIADVSEYVFRSFVQGKTARSSR
jgi:mono/diheme cytochrome c family protein